jgi:pyruvate/2-oxoglutarate dehydrogenase complex dihydrolipoamide dehydrogenase (E3) component
MAVDYDLVILGGSANARYAAWLAVQAQARVALVEPETSQFGNDLLRSVRRAAFIEWVRTQRGNFHLCQWPNRPPMPTALSLVQGLERSTDAAEIYAEWRSPTVLAAAGVDVVLGQGEFCRRPRPGVLVNGRLLRSRSYLVAPPLEPLPMTVPGLEAAEVWTVDSLWGYPPPACPQHLVMVGGTPEGLALAQAFRHLGSAVTLLCDRPTLSPHLDPEMGDRLQSSLEAAGIVILTETQLKQGKLELESTDINPWTSQLQLSLKHPALGLRSLQADALVLDPELQPLLTALNLEALGLDPHQFPVDDHLRTPHPQVWALDMARADHPAQTQVEVAVHNALFPRRRSLSQTIPIRVIPTVPPLVSLGLTESEAHQHYGEAVEVLRYPYRVLAAAHGSGELTGWVKLLVHHNGRLLGGHVHGAGALELAGAIALVLQSQQSIQAFLTLPLPEVSYASVLKLAAQEWQQQRHQQGWRRDLREGWFEWRRAWTR